MSWFTGKNSCGNTVRDDRCYGGKLVGKSIKKKQVGKCRKSQIKLVFHDRTGILTHNNGVRTPVLIWELYRYIQNKWQPSFLITFTVDNYNFHAICRVLKQQKIEARILICLNSILQP
jgi:hypothetical protein